MWGNPTYTGNSGLFPDRVQMHIILKKKVLRSLLRNLSAWYGLCMTYRHRRLVSGDYRPKSAVAHFRRRLAIMDINWSDPETFWLNVTNMAFGVITLVVLLFLLGSVAAEVYGRAKKRAAA